MIKQILRILFSFFVIIIIFTIDLYATSWEQSTTIDDAEIRFITVDSINYSPPAIYAATNKGVYRSTDKAENWKLLNPDSVLINKAQIDYTIMNIVTLKNVMFIATSLHLFKSTDLGETWEKIYSSSASYLSISFIYENNKLYVSEFEKMFISSDMGQTWSNAKVHPYNAAYVESNLFIYKNFIFYSDFNGLYRSSDDGDNWIKLPVADYQILNLLISNNRIFANTALNNFYYSDDNGMTWTKVINNIPKLSFTQNSTIKGYILINDEIYLNSAYFIYKLNINDINKTNVSWQQIDNSGFDSTYYSCTNYFHHSFAMFDNSMFRITNHGLMIKSPGKDWQLKNKEMKASNFDYNVFGFDDNINNFLVCHINKIFKTSNRGISWELSKEFANTRSISKIRKTNDTLYLSTNSAVYISTDKAQSWQKFLDTNSTFNEILDVLFHNGKIYVSTQKNFENFYYASNDKGKTWIKHSIFDFDMVNKQNILFKIEYNGGFRTGYQVLHSSTDQGITWKALGLQNLTVNSAIIVDEIIYISTYFGLYVSYDYGNTIIPFNFEGNNVSSISYFGKNLVCTLLDNNSNKFVFALSNDKGEHWYNITANASKSTKNIFAGNDSIIFHSRPDGLFSFDTRDLIINFNVRTNPYTCSNNTETYYSQFVSKNFQYHWEVENGKIIGSDSDTLVKIQWNNFSVDTVGRIKVSIKGSSDKDTASTFYSVKIYAPYDISINNDSVKYCQNGIKNYATTNKAGFVNKWQVSGGRILNSEYDNNIWVLWDSNATKATIQLKQSLANGNCEKNTELSIDILPDPIPSPKIEGEFVVCSNDTITYSTKFVENHTYKWQAINGQIVETNNNQIKVVWKSSINGKIIVDEYNSTGCNFVNEREIFINGFNLKLDLDQNACILDTIYYQAPISPNFLYKWTISANRGTIIGSDSADRIAVIWTKPSLRNVKVDITHKRNLCKFTLTSSLTNPNYEAVLALDTLMANPAEQNNNLVEIPVIFKSGHCVQNANQPDSLTFVLNCNKSVFLPLTYDNISYKDENQIRKITVKIKLKNIKENDTLVKIRGYILLGNQIESDIFLSDFVWKSANNINTISENSKIILSGIADDYTGKRLISSNSINLVSIYPNPASENLNIKINYNEASFSDKESTNHSINQNTEQNELDHKDNLVNIVINDILGNQICEKSIYLQNGENNINFELANNLLSANYVLLVKSKNQTQSQAFIILK